MVDLKCKCTSCIHNQNCNCTADEIFISQETICDNFIEAKEKDVEISDEITHPLVRQNTCVSCSANCIFNKSGDCVANGISVSTDKNEPICDTFLTN